MLRIETREVVDDESPVLAYQRAIEPDLPAAVSLVLEADQIPVDVAVVTVVRLRVRLSGREMKRFGDLLVKQDVEHRLGNVGVKADRKLADEPRPLIRIEDFVEVRGVRATRLNDVSVCELKPYGAMSSSMNRRPISGSSSRSAASFTAASGKVRPAALTDSRSTGKP